MSFVLVPPTAVAAGLLGLALTRATHRSLGGAARDATAWCLAVIGIGVASAVVVPAGAVLPEPWRRFGIASAVAAGAALVLALLALRRRPALGRLSFALAATIAGVAVSALSDAVANKTDGLALPLLTFVSGLGAVLLRDILLHRTSLSPMGATAIAAAGFSIASFLFARPLDPVLVGDNGLPLSPVAPFHALVAGMFGGFALSIPRVTARPAAPPLLLAAAALAGYWRGGWYGVALAGIGIGAIAAPSER